MLSYDEQLTSADGSSVISLCPTNSDTANKYCMVIRKGHQLVARHSQASALGMLVLFGWVWYSWSLPSNRPPSWCATMPASEAQQGSSGLHAQTLSARQHLTLSQPIYTNNMAQDSDAALSK